MIASDSLVFCTLFDSNYLDKGLALYRSMIKNIRHFRLYIFAFDQACYRVLKGMALKNVIVVPVADIMDEQLENIRWQRSKGEFCWTCTPIVIEYVLMEYGEQICTYIDADCYFFADPKPLIEEIMHDGCSVGIVGHRFERNWDYFLYMFKNGKYCVEFNTFVRDEQGLLVLKDWKKECLEWCYHRHEDGRLGDQKYLDKWMWKYSRVHEQKHLGGGVAPWNLHLYGWQGSDGESVWLKDKKGNKIQLIFYHFEGMKYLHGNKVYLNLWNVETKDTHKKVNIIYGEYFREIRKVRDILKKKHGIGFEHMIMPDEKSFLERFSCGRMCSENGLLGGMSKWNANKKNNFVSLKKFYIAD